MNGTLLEIAVDCWELRELGLEEEEIDGYICFYIDSYTEIPPMEA